MREFRLTHRLRGPHVVHQYGYFIEPPYFGLVIEFCTEVKLGQHEHVDCVELAIEAARAITHLHTQAPPFIHRDIKWENFLLSEEGAVKLTDFGEAVEYAGGNEELEIIGSPVYMAPEMVRGKFGMAVYGPAVDCYSFAISLWELFSGETAFAGMNHMDVMDAVGAGQRPDKQFCIPEGIYGIIEGGWSDDATQRLTAESILGKLAEYQEQHPRLPGKHDDPVVTVSNVLVAEPDVYYRV
eukprot:TRINITY_DN14618_c0_g1_i1.p1 TRINITY_DN14618_c0_g1~~TRINITY_DN14618_c0_g1_i1.p1  ORF type:complete len:240 (+),score=49.13 TRINITY_DN14618_c0_g1_i1:179-898(+)